MRTLVLALGALFADVASAAADLPPGLCPAGGVAGLQQALERSDAGVDPTAELDLAACYRALAQEVPEAAALGRAIDEGLPEADAGLVRARLDEIGWPPPPVEDDGLAAQAAAESGDSDEGLGTSDGVDPLWAYTLTGVSAASLVAATAVGFIALDADADSGDALTPGIAAAVCAGVGIATGIAAILLWPDDDEVAPAPGPGDVGLGLVVRF